MSGVIPKFERGPVTYEVSSIVAGGRLVEPDGVTKKVKYATAGSLKCLGVATKDAQPRGTVTGVDAFGNETINMVNVTEYTAVGGSGAIYPVTYAADAAFGDMLICAANGTVTPAGLNPDARTLVGQCREVGGVVVATNAVGLAKITV